MTSQTVIYLHLEKFNMQAASSTNPNALWLNGRGIWLGYILSVVFLHFLLQCVPIFSVAIVWTLTHLIHNLVSGRGCMDALSLTCVKVLYFFPACRAIISCFTT